MLAHADPEAAGTFLQQAMEKYLFFQSPMIPESVILIVNNDPDVIRNLESDVRSRHGKKYAVEAAASAEEARP